MGKHGSRSRLPLQTAQATCEDGTRRSKIVVPHGPESRKTLAPDRSTRFSVRLQEQWPDQLRHFEICRALRVDKNPRSVVKELSTERGRALQLLSNLQG